MSSAILPDEVLAALKFVPPKVKTDAKYGDLVELWRNEAKSSMKDTGFVDLLAKCGRGPSDDVYGPASGPALSESFLDMLQSCIIPGFLPWNTVINGLRSAALAVAKGSERPAPVAGLPTLGDPHVRQSSSLKSLPSQKLPASVEMSVVAVFHSLRALVATHPDDCVPILEALRGILAGYSLQVRLNVLVLR
jgi:hypothetical protein